MIDCNMIDLRLCDAVVLHAVVVTYHPDEKVLCRLLDVMAGQAEKIWVVDNGGGDEGWKSNVGVKVEVVECGRNIGVAAAYNVGVAKASAAGASHVMTLDQDSNPDYDMVDRLLEGLDRWSAKNIAVIGPIYSDVKGGRGFFVRKRALRLERIYGAHDGLICVDHVISSGSIFPIGVFEVVGGFRDELFIDYVDTEWCLRAISMGYSVIGSFDAHMRHDLGDAVLHIMGHEIPIHSPLRNYYLMRNGVWLMCRKWVGWQWRLIDGIRLSKMFLFFSFFHPQRMKSIKMMLKGLVDGVRGRMGAY